MMRRRLVPVRGVLLALVVLFGSRPAAAQTVRFGGRGELHTDALVKRLLARPGQRLFARDTVVSPADTIDGDVLVVGATVKFENLIRGDLTIIDANVFLRPGSRVTGAVTSIAAGFFPAPSATVAGDVTELKDAPYRAEVRGDGVRVVGTRAPSMIDPDGVRGLLAPSYDRVNGAGLHAGARFLLPRIGALEPELHLRGDYYVARERGGGGAELGFRSAGGLRARIGVERVAATNDRWLRGDFPNSVSFLVLGHDLHDAFDARRAWGAIGFERPREDGFAVITLRAQVEDAKSLPSRDPWHAWGDDTARANPAIDDGRIASLALQAAAEWRRPAFQATLSAAVEKGIDAADGDFTFTTFDVAGSWAMHALADHTYTLSARARAPFSASEILPRQRWSGIGGRGTLPTLEDLERTGDRMVFVANEYSVPVPGVELPVLGAASIELVHFFGTAWSPDSARGVGTRTLAQNLGLRLRFHLVSFMGVTDPADTGSFAFIFGLGRAPVFPWTPPRIR